MYILKKDMRTYTLLLCTIKEPQLYNKSLLNFYELCSNKLGKILESLKKRKTSIGFNKLFKSLYKQE